MNASVRQDSLTDWPDTSHDEPPADHLYKSATWLLGRHRMLAELAARLPGVVDREDGQLGVNVELLAEGLHVLDEWMAARHVYCRRHRAPEDDRAYDAWEAAGPQFPATPAGSVAAEAAATSGSEKTRLRLLATFSSPGIGDADIGGGRIIVSDFRRMDASGQRLLADWMTAAMAA